MHPKHVVLGAALVIAVGAPAAVTTANAADGIYVPLLSYRTGAYAGSGTPIANGMADYLNMLNERDGGIGGVKIVVDECETGYDTKKGVECYESLKGKGPVVVNPYSTGITLQLIPKAAVDKIPYGQKTETMAEPWGGRASAGLRQPPPDMSSPSVIVTNSI